MADQMVKVVARIRAKADKADPLRQILVALVDATRKEPGCISYQLLQNAANPADFVCVEEWKSSKAVDEHLQTPHVQDAVTKAAPYLAGAPEIASYSVVK